MIQLHQALLMDKKQDVIVIHKKYACQWWNIDGSFPGTKYTLDDKSGIIALQCIKKKSKSNKKLYYLLVQFSFLFVRMVMEMLNLCWFCDLQFPGTSHSKW